MIGGDRGDPIALLVIASLFRDEMPWMYELGVEAYRLAREGSLEEALASRKRFQKAAEAMRRGPFGLEEMGVDSRMIHMMLRELDHLLGGDTEPEPEPEVEPTAGYPSKAKRDKHG
jgi:hypothetical protein